MNVYQSFSVSMFVCIPSMCFGCVIVSFSTLMDDINISLQRIYLLYYTYTYSTCLHTECTLFFWFLFVFLFCWLLEPFPSSSSSLYSYCLHITLLDIFFFSFGLLRVRICSFSISFHFALNIDLPFRNKLQDMDVDGNAIDDDTLWFTIYNDADDETGKQFVHTTSHKSI